MTTKITSANLDTSLLNTISQSSGPKITNIQVTDNAYAVLDDTAVDVGGGYIKLTGTNFATGCQVLIGTTAATSTTFVSATEVRAQVPAMNAGSYVIYLVNADGGVAIRVNGLTYSASPSWVTGSTLTEQQADQAISIQLSASGATSYSLDGGSSLPAGLSLSSGGLLSGTVTGLEAETTYTFTVLATDAENQDSPRSFSLLVTVIIIDPYFNQVSLLLAGDGTNAAQNNTFLDSSTNNFTITRNGNTTQGTFSPFSVGAGEWSNYFDGTGDYLQIAYNSAFAFGTGDFTIEGWWFINSLSAAIHPITFAAASPTSGSNVGFFIYIDGSANEATICNSGAYYSVTGWTAALNTWQHFAFVRQSGTLRFYINGVQVGNQPSANVSINDNSGWTLKVGAYTSSTRSWNGNLSNIRILKGTCQYPDGTTFTPSTAPLTAITNTSLLTCQSNRFVDNSSNAFAITRNGDVAVQAFSPFAPSAAYSASTNGGSAYFDGSGDYLSVSAQSFTGDFTLEAWIYPNRMIDSGGSSVIFVSVDPNNQLGINSSGGSLNYYNGSVSTTATNALTLNAWQHIALCRSGSTTRIFVNGVVVATKSSDSGTRTFTYIGQFPDGNNYYFQGYMAGARWTADAQYTATFTPPTAPPTAITNTQLLLKFTNAGILDATAKNDLETVGNAQISTTQSKFGGSSMYFDGTGDVLKIPSSPNFAFGTGDFTVEFWVRFNATSDSGFLGSNAAGGFDFAFLSNSLRIGRINVGWDSTFSWTPSTNTWYHIAFTRSSGTARAFVDGTQVGSNSSNTNSYSQNGEFSVIGGSTTGDRLLNGFIDDLRITKGVARYTANFTAPTKALLLR